MTAALTSLTAASSSLSDQISAGALPLVPLPNDKELFL
jgi:hypothetical protein